MADSIKIRLDTSQYELPTQEDITSAKQFILRRNNYARLLESKIDGLLAEAAQEVVTICYKYDVDPNDFYISSQYNEQMMDEISDVMDDIESEILDLIYEYSTRCTSDKDKISNLAAWIALLGRGNRNLQGTLDGYLYKTMKDWEAAIAAMRYAEMQMADAVTKIKSNLHHIYTMPEVQAAFRHAQDFNATYIRSRGVQQGAVGLPANGSDRVTNMAKTTLQMAWMRSLVVGYENGGAVGIYILRGSSYPCELCDDACGFYPMKYAQGLLPVHPHCQCYAIPIYAIEYNKDGINNQLEKTELARAKDDIRESGEMPTNDELVTFGNLKTERMLRSDKVLNRLLWHTKSMQELGAAIYIWNNPDKLEYLRESKLGEVKDLSKEADRKNIESKKRRKIRTYNVYSFNFESKTWLIKLEQHKKGFEQFYSFTK